MHYIDCFGNKETVSRIIGLRRLSKSYRDHKPGKLYDRDGRLALFRSQPNILIDAGYTPDQIFSGFVDWL
jgi:hypothetical protein